ncbi:hypothetical protein, partial [uncultured Reyranella sp.]|uniref:hypothetical protein n=1 Tax=uncultured Reyranella sp. TaxID=735512 RepID=UPI00259CDCFE
SELGDVETYASGAAEAIARMGDDLRWFQLGSSDLRQAMDEVGAAAGQAFNRDPVAGFADALGILIESQDALADSGADADSYMRRLIDAFVDTTGIEGFEGRIRSVDDLIGQMADGTAAVTPELQSLAQAFQDARDAGDPTEEALAALVAAMADLPEVTDEAAAAMAMAVDPTGELADELDLVADGFEQVQAASMAAVAGIDAYLDAQRAATDPVFALHRALGQVEDAHTSYNEAVRKHGRDSGEAADASMEIVSALLAAEAAAIDGELSIDAFRDTIDRFAESGRIPDEVMRTLEGTLDRLTAKQGDHVAGFENFSGALVDASGNVVALGGKMDALPQQVQTELRASDVASEVIASLGELYEALPEELRTYVEATDDASAVVAYLEGRYEDVPEEIRTDLIAHDNASRMIENVRSALGRVPRSINIALNATVTGSGALDSWARRIPQARGGVLDFYADGGLRESHVAQIAPAGAMRLWAEPETGGEAYIPLAAAKRDRSLQIWEETGRRLGVQSFASGGLTSSGTYDTRHLFGMTRGASFGDAAGHLRAIVAMEAAYASMTRSIEQMEQAKRRQEIVDRRRNAETAEERRQAADDLANHDRQVQLAEQRYQIEQRIAAARANQRIAANREQFEFDQMDVDDQIADLER